MTDGIFPTKKIRDDVPPSTRSLSYLYMYIYIDIDIDLDTSTKYSDMYILSETIFVEYAHRVSILTFSLALAFFSDILSAQALLDSSDILSGPCIFSDILSAQALLDSFSTCR